MAGIDDWLKTHAGAEKKLSRVIARFFREQNKRVLAALNDFESLTSSIVPQAFDQSAEHSLLVGVVADPILEFIAGGAVNVMAQRPAPAIATKAVDLDDFELPARVRSSIELAFSELMEQGYWREIQAGTEGKITDVLTAGVEEGLSKPNLIKRLKLFLGELAGVRAAAIARTETTGAYGAGHQASYQTLAEDGEISGKEWLAVVDGDTRSAHVSLNGSQVGALGEFDVGGSSAPYPGHHSLPAAQRVNCRCTTAGVFDD